MRAQPPGEWMEEGEMLLAFKYFFFLCDNTERSYFDSAFSPADTLRMSESPASMIVIADTR